MSDLVGSPEYKFSHVAAHFILTMVNSLFSAVSLGALAITENYPANVRILCTVSGTQWNSHYLETHNLTWTVTKNGKAQRVSTNGELEASFDKARYSIYFDPKRYFVILDMKGINDRVK